MPIFKTLSFLLVLLLCSCSNAGKSTTNSSDNPPEMSTQSTEKSARDTSLTEHTDEIKKMEKESRRKYPSHFSDHLITRPPSDGKSGGTDQQGGESDPLKKREMRTKGGGK